LARRPLKTRRPPVVFMRLRKPWVRLRRITDGWKVRFMGFAFFGKSLLLELVAMVLVKAINRLGCCG